MDRAQLVVGCGLHSPNPVLVAEEHELKEQVKRALDMLTFREHEIMKLRYGLDGGYAYTLEEVGKLFKVTRERVRQIEAKALRKLRHPTRSQLLAAFACGGT